MMDRAALVLGGSGGIGLAVARKLAGLGYGITIQGRRQERTSAAAESLEAALPVAADLSSGDEMARVVSEHVDRWGRLDVLVNSAGLGIGQRIEEIEGKSLELQTAINLRAAVFATRESLPVLRRAGKEHGNALIAHISSWAGVHPPAWLSVYGATKAALNSFAESSQLELAGTGIRVSAICPATVDTEMSAYARSEIPPGEMLSPDDVAEAVRFLLVVSANCYVPRVVLGRVGDLTPRT